MPLTENQKQNIRNRIEKILNLDAKISEKRSDIIDGDTSPFLLSLFGLERMLMVKVGQSIQTTMGMSFYEQTCELLANEVGYEVTLQKKVKGFISPVIENYLQRLNKTEYSPNREKELSDIRRLSIDAQNHPDFGEYEYPDSTVDVYIRTPSGKEILIDITTVKCNKKDFRVLKEKTLRWSAYRMTHDQNIDIEAYFAIPYNPESSDNSSITYNRFSSLYDRKDILVGDELWAKVSNNNCTTNDLIDIFKEFGSRMEKEINNSFEKI